MLRLIECQKRRRLKWHPEGIWPQRKTDGKKKKILRKRRSRCQERTGNLINKSNPSNLSLFLENHNQLINPVMAITATVKRTNTSIRRTTETSNRNMLRKIKIMIEVRNKRRNKRMLRKIKPRKYRNRRDK